MLNALYNQVDEEVHKLVILSNKSQKQLETLLEVRKFEEQTQQVSLNSFTLDICDADFLLLFFSLDKMGYSVIKQPASLSRLNSGSVVRERNNSQLWNH